MSWNKAAALVLLSFSAATFAAPGDRVVGGIDAEQGEWPFQAFVLIDVPTGQYGCGGTLIAPTWVLTAAHCTEDRARNQFSVSAISTRLGSVTKSSGGELRKVIRVVRHQAYQANHALENDIALLELASPVGLPAVRLEKATGVRTTAANSPWARVLGWGLRVGGDPNSGSEILQAAALPLVDTERCDRAMRMKFPSAGGIDARRLCAGQSVGGVDSCNGDSGGPLLVSDGSGQWQQVGIVSYGVENCGSADAYGVYTRVASYAEWITRAIGGPASQNAATSTPLPIQLGLDAAAPNLIDAASQNRDGLTIEILPKLLKIGEPFRIAVTSPVSGYLALFDIDPQNEVLQIFPNPRGTALGKDGRIEAGRSISIPDPSYGFQFRAADPKGRGRLIAVVAQNKAEFANLISAAEGLKTIANPQSRFARLEVVMKIKPANSVVDTNSGSNSGEQNLARPWITGLADYMIK